MTLVSEIIKVNNSHLGVALDSFIQLGIIIGVLTLGVLILSYSTRFLHREDTKWIENRPCLIPSVTFLFLVLVGITIIPLPISPYKGINTVDVRVWEPRHESFEVREEAYMQIIEIRAHVSLHENESLDVYIDFILEGDIFETIEIEFDTLPNGGIADEYLVLTEIPPGQYRLYIYYQSIIGGVPQSQRTGRIEITVSQILASDHLEELALWDTYKFILFVSCFFVLLAGICIDLEDMERQRVRIRHKRGSIYNPRIRR